MGLFKKNPAKKEAKKKQKQEAQASRRAFKLEKKGLRNDNKSDRRDNRTERAHGRQDTRADQTATRVQGKTDRTDIRTQGKVLKHISRDQADMVAYENHMNPIDRTANALAAGGRLAEGIGRGAASIGTSGLIGGGSEDTYTDGVRNADREIRRYNPGEAAPPEPGIMGIPPMVLGIGALIAFFLFSKNKGRGSVK